MTFIKVGDRLINSAQICSAQYFPKSDSSGSAIYLWFPSCGGETEINRAGEAKFFGAVADQVWSALLEEIKDLVVIEDLTPETNL